jgi:hypothetical protein
MSYLGNAPALAYTSFSKQDFTVSATTSYSLDHPVANANELALFINFVRQEPTASYSASGTTLTLTEATSVGDDMYCVFLGKAVQTVNPPNNSVNESQLNYPLTTFSSTGIDDNASANALTIDSSSNLQFNSGFGSVATAYGVRVWLRYDQVNNVVEASGGVSSVTDSNTGRYIINFTNNMPDADYALGGWSGRNANPTVSGESNSHNVGNITISTGDGVNNTWVYADVDDSTVIIVK